MIICTWLEGDPPKVRCCELIDQEKECPECSALEGGPVRWHSAFYCPFCRGPGVLRNE